MRVVKLGGSLLSHLRTLLPALAGREVLIVPGGGLFADAVRSACKLHEPSSKTAHEMALHAMQQYGLLLSDLSGIPTITSLQDFRGRAVLLPLKIVLSSPLPATWDVGSDTIACYVARLAGLREFIKLTDVEGVMLGDRVVSRVEAGKLLNRNTCLDKSLPFYLQLWKMSCRVVSGKDAEAVRRALDGEDVGTLVIGGR